jgi:hypothetical protein
MRDAAGAAGHTMTRRVGSPGYRAVVCMLVSLFLLAIQGCATRMSMEEAVGESAKLEFRVLDAHMPAPQLYWKESPWHIETLLRPEPPLPDCIQVRIYANRSPEAPVLLSDRATEVQPVKLATTAEELAAWERVPDLQCALLVSVGEIVQDDFTGVSISIPGKVFKRHSMALQGDVDAKHRWWGMVPVAAVFDVTHIPLYYAVGLIGQTSANPVEPVTVIFQFPDGSRRSTNLDYGEATRLLKTNYPAVLSLPFSRKLVRTWTRAALCKLELEFTEEAGGELVHDEWLPDSLRLKMVDGYVGNWVYRLDTDTESNSDIAVGMQDASSIRFELATPDNQ